MRGCGSTCRPVAGLADEPVQEARVGAARRHFLRAARSRTARPLAGTTRDRASAGRATSVPAGPGGERDAPASSAAETARALKAGPREQRLILLFSGAERSARWAKAFADGTRGQESGWCSTSRRGERRPPPSRLSDDCPARCREFAKSALNRRTPRTLTNYSSCANDTDLTVFKRRDCRNHFATSRAGSYNSATDNLASIAREACTSGLLRAGVGSFRQPDCAVEEGNAVYSTARAGRIRSRRWSYQSRVVLCLRGRVAVGRRARLVKGRGCRRFLAFL